MYDIVCIYVMRSHTRLHSSVVGSNWGEPVHNKDVEIRKFYCWTSVADGGPKLTLTVRGSTLVIRI